MPPTHKQQPTALTVAALPPRIVAEGSVEPNVEPRALPPAVDSSGDDLVSDTDVEAKLNVGASVNVRWSALSFHPDSENGCTV